MRSTVLIVLLALAVAPAAEARKRPHRVTFQFAVTVARGYWEKRGVRVQCQPHKHVLTWAETKNAGTPTDVYMLADTQNCEVFVTPWAEPLRKDRDLYWMYCADVVHEVGHLAGLDHDYGGIMGEGNITPWGCSHPRKFRRTSPYMLTRTGF